MIEFRVRDHCWHACSVVGEGNIKRLTPRPYVSIEYSYREFTRSSLNGKFTRRERSTGGADWRLPLDQYGRPSTPIIYIPNPSYQMTVQVSRCPNTPNSPPTRYEILSQKFFMNCQVKRQYIKIPNPRIVHHSNPNRSLNKSLSLPGIEPVTYLLLVIGQTMGKLSWPITHKI